MSSEPDNRRGYGPLVEGFKLVDFGDIDQIKEAITENIAAVILEPIQVKRASTFRRKVS